MLKKLQSVLLTAVLVCIAWTASAQNRTATGVVSDNIGPVIGAGVVVAGTTNGTVTDANGSFSINNVPVGATIQVTCIGYASVEYVFDGTPAKIVLKEDSELLDEVVVTALGISREKKSLGYAVQDVKAEELTRGGGVTLTDALTGKVAGLMINNSATGAGGSTRVVLRGNSSLSDNNSPLYVVDGVPYDNGGTPGADQAGLWGSVDHQSGAFDINPEDIESVSVLKGATAAALYGSRAGNGVILITTKKGGKGQEKIGVSYSGKFTWSPVAYFPALQNKYGQGTLGEYDKQATGSWGPEMSATRTEDNWWDGTSKIPFIGTENPWKEFYRTGNSQSNNVTLAGGGKDNPFRLTLGYDNTNSVVKNSNIKRTSVDFVTSNKLTDWLQLDVKANYVNTAGNNRQPRGAYGSSFGILTMPRNIRISDLAEHWLDANAAAAGAGAEAQINWHEVSPNCQNPFFIQNNLVNGDSQNKFFGVGSLTINLMKNLTFKVKEGITWASVTDKTTRLYDTSGFNWPEYSQKQSTTLENNLEGLLSYNNKFGDFEFGASVGGNIMHYKSETLRAVAKNIPFSGAYYIRAGQLDGDTYNDIYEKEIQSLYAFANLGWKNFLFLDVTARNDWSSTLPAANRSYFYPSVSVSYLLTGMLDEMGMSYDKDILDYGKFRASWAKVGKDTDPYQLMTLLGTTSGINDLNYITYPTTRANANLKPEMVTSWEVGTEWHFFKNRLGLDLTYYHSNTVNQVMRIDLPYSSGVQRQWINAGNIQNQGIEFQLNADFIRTRDLTFGATFNFAKNWNKVLELYHNAEMGIDVDRYSLGGINFASSGDGTVYAIEGQQIGTFVATGYKRDANGNKVIGTNGLPVIESNKEIASVAPDFTGSFGLNFAWKGLSFNALFSFQKGGSLYSATEYMTLHSGTGFRTLDRSERIIEGVLEDGSKNNKPVTAQNYWNNIPMEECVYDASFLKLSELSLGYSLPKKFLERTFGGYVDNVRVSAVGSNLFYFVKHTPGTTPDGAHTESSLMATALDLCPYPATRNFGVAINIGF